MTESSAGDRAAELTVLTKAGLAAWVTRRIEERLPGAVVRFVDGEEHLLEARPEDARSMEIATWRLEGQSGLRFAPDAVLEVREGLARAFDEADVLGMLFGYGYDEERVNRLTSMYLERLADGREPAAITSCHLHHDFVDKLPGLLAGRRVSAITCRDVKPVLERDWGARDVAVYQVPSQHPARDVDGEYEAAMHGARIWPDRHAQIREELTVREPGEVFLVGAGLFGKDLCIEVRERGGLALDLGSALDRIVGKVTRGPLRRVHLLHGEGLSAAEIAADLNERYRTKVDDREIVKLVEEGQPHYTGNPHEWRTVSRILTPGERIEKQREQLDRELREASRERGRLGRRLEGLERERAARAALVATLEDEVRRSAQSRSFRWGHGVLSRLSRWLLWRPARRSGLDAAAELLRGAREDLAPERNGGGAAGVPAIQTGRTGRRRAAAPPPPSTPQSPAAPPQPPPPKPAISAAAERERAMREDFRERYASLFRASDGVPPLGEAELALPLPRDRRGILLGAAGDSEPAHPGVDVVVCVHDAPEDVRLCLWSLMHSSTRPFHLIVVDDGSGPETAAMLDGLAAREPQLELLRNEGPDHGYTRAANIGLRASTGAHVVLLNSDTIVSPGWLERIVACAESDAGIGVVGPLSNAATHQSAPAVKDGGRWAVNELPRWLSVDSMAMLLAGLSARQRPRLPFLNGFCYAITRAAIERVGSFDEERFGSGYCEENDFSIRAQDAGFSLAVADDAYVFHSKSRSYTTAGRDEVAGRNYRVFLDKHGRERVERMLAELDQAAALQGLREATAAAVGDEDATIEAFRAVNPEPLSILFVLHGMPEGSAGGVHSVYQETAGLRRLGAPARIAIAAEGMKRARAAYADAEDVFVPFADEAELARHAGAADVVVATHHTTVGLVGRLSERHGGFRPAYYVQDYEPFFAEAGSAQLVEALDSYTATPGQIVFAKTHWLRNLIGHLHGVDVAKVEPSLDTAVYSTEGRRERDGGPLRIAAMLRPRTPRRQPALTLDVLTALAAEHGDRVQVTTFGCPVEAAQALGGKPPGPHLGLLSRHQVADLLRRTDVFLDASTYQAFGRTALEAMACGCTAVAPRIGGAAQFIRDGENGFLVDTFSPDPAVAAIGRLVEDEALLRELQTSAVEEAAGHSILRAALSEYALFARTR